MAWYAWLGAAIALVAALWALAVGALVLGGRRAEARALATFVPDCIVLLRRLIADPEVPRRRKLAAAAAIAYLALPFDVIPDFIPIAGQLDDAIVVALALRHLLRSGGPALLARHWPGPPQSLALIARLSGAAS
jgi:uncharacterized membrane protein YkvA (DUF1232 family)